MAIKQFRCTTKRQERDVRNEIDLILSLRHPSILLAMAWYMEARAYPTSGSDGRACTESFL